MKIKRKRTVYIFSLAMVFFLSVICPPVLGKAENNTLPESESQGAKEHTGTITTLKGIVHVMKEIQKHIIDERERFKTAETPEQKLEIANKINKHTEHLESLMKNFEEIATGLSMETFVTSPKKQFDWKEEIYVLIGPIIQEFRNLTAHPRLIENLRAQETYYKKKISLIKNALNNIHKLIAQTHEEELKEQLITLENEWFDKGKDVSTQLTIAQYQLAEKLSEKKSLLESSQNITRLFFKSRGKNFCLSILAFFAVFFLLRYIHRYFYKSSSIYKTVKRSFYVRLTDVFYHVFTFLCATGALLLVLYTSGDWVLLGLAFIFIFGLIWTAKQTLPRFYEQCKLLLNIGTVRENELVIYHGLPWKVTSLNFYTKLVNPELKGGMIRLPIRELEGIRSRPYHQDEPWFPCKIDDWVILTDGTIGRVTVQTPEAVQLILHGESHKTYPTADFLRLNPINISKNFFIHVTFGIDYQHQAMSTTEVPNTLKEMIQRGLEKKGYAEDLHYLEVELKEAGTSSLNYAIIAGFSGRVAKDYYRLPRLIQTLAVDACNTYGWVIPFKQITLHTAPSKGQKDTRIKK
ncbi:MAG: hypothetical protein MRJ65_08770 [Candidatus Brocadiaceae bacterium]|nr:hypothetical protein [Candidatus Brocadiaceae bacterium]